MYERKVTNAAGSTSSAIRSLLEILSSEKLKGCFGFSVSFMFISMMIESKAKIEDA